MDDQGPKPFENRGIAFRGSGRDPLVQMQLSGCLIVTFVLLAACVIPLFVLNMAQTALTNLHLHPTVALLVLAGIVFGSAVNLPVTVIELDQEVPVPVYQPMGAWVPFPRFERMQRETVVAVNVGGCVIPVLLAIHLLRFLLEGGPRVATVLLVGILLNTAVCYRMAVPVPKLGIRLPFLLPAAVALVVTWLGLGFGEFDAYRAPLAFVTGISGPLLGADLLHWKDFKRIAAGTISIGGAGTWDGIVLSGLMAAFVA